MAGDCASLAVAIHEITGWPLVVMVSPCHALVRVPGTGQLLDAAGLHPPDCLTGFRWQETDADEVAARFGLTGTPAEVLADARELLAGLSTMPSGPFPWRPRSGRVTAGDPASCGLSSAS